MAIPSQELKIYFEGYWQCRQATDPDPSDDPRGTSGYTYAVGAESDLDLVIRLQEDEISPVDFRLSDLPNYPEEIIQIRTSCQNMEELKASITNPSELAEIEKKLFGIFVTKATLDGEDYDAGTELLRGGKMRWLPFGKQMDENGHCEGPRYELRNEIIFHHRDGIIMPIDPFHMQIEGNDNSLLIERSDPLDARRPNRQIWELPLEVYQRRNPQVFHSISAEVLEALGFDSNSAASPQFNAYFQKRKEWLELELSMAKTDVEKSAIENRIFGIEFFSENQRIESKLGLKAQWDFTLRGDDSQIKGLDSLGLKIDSGQDWPISFWMGGFDGDLMRGYMRGSLTLPVERD